MISMFSNVNISVDVKKKYNRTPRAIIGVFSILKRHLVDCRHFQSGGRPQSPKSIFFTFPFFGNHDFLDTSAQ